jgi:tetratricopeptide (TPR) repeat protein
MTPSHLIALVVALLCAVGDRPRAQRTQRPTTAAALRAAYERGEYEVVETSVRQARDLPRLVRELREGLFPPRRVPVAEMAFALEFGGTALFVDHPEGRREAEGLLVAYQHALTQAIDVQPLECVWHIGAIALLEARGSIALATDASNRALTRCPDHARLLLGRARLIDRHWSFDLGGAASLSPPMVYLGPNSNPLRARIVNEQVREATMAYEAAIGRPETSVEARVRLAWLCLRTGAVERADALLEGVTNDETDREMLYLAHLVRGQVLTALGRRNDAATALSDALQLWPDAQSARVALMAVELLRGDRRQAARLAEEIETAPSDQTDPWWLYWGGDARLYPRIIGRLREVAR